MNNPLAFFGSSMGAGEILLIMVVILLLFGAERLPAMARSLGKALDEFRRSARDLTHDLMDSHPSRPEPSNLPSVKPPSESLADAPTLRACPPAPEPRWTSGPGSSAREVGTTPDKMADRPADKVKDSSLTSRPGRNAS